MALSSAKGSLSQMSEAKEGKGPFVLAEGRLAQATMSTLASTSRWTLDYTVNESGAPLPRSPCRSLLMLAPLCPGRLARKYAILPATPRNSA